MDTLMIMIFQKLPKNAAACQRSANKSQVLFSTLFSKINLHTVTIQHTYQMHEKCEK